MKTKLNCIFLGSFLFPNGYAATKRKQQFLDYIISQGDFARVLLTLKLAKGSELNENSGIYNGIPYEVIGPNVKPNFLLPFTFFIFTLKSFHRLIIYKKSYHKNIIVSFGINLDTLFLLLFAKIVGYKIVFDIVEDFSKLETKKKIINRFKYQITNITPNIFRSVLADGFSVISSYLYKSVKNKKVSVPVVLVPISAENLNSDHQQKISSCDHFKLLYSGTYGEKDGLPILIGAFCKFSETHTNARLVLTGKCPQTIKSLLYEKLGSLTNVELTGRLSDKDYYNTLLEADVMLMTRNNSEFANAGFPYKLGEYLATGNPVICTTVSDISIYLIDKTSALLIPPNDEMALYNAIRFLYHNKDEREIIGKNGKDVCNNFFNPKKNSKLFYDLLINI